MKKFHLILTAFIMCLSLSSCTNQQEDIVSDDSAHQSSSITDSNNDANDSNNIDDEKSKLKAETLEKERAYYETLENSIEFLSTKVSSPASLIINEVIVHDTGYQVSYYMNVSYKNNLGNLVDSYVCVVNNILLQDSETTKQYQTYYKIANGRQTNFELVSRNYYINTKTNTIVALLDLADYDESGFIR